MNQYLVYKIEVASWLLDIGDVYINRGDYENALRWNYLASDILYRQNRELSSSRIESNLQLIANTLLQNGEIQSVVSGEVNQKETCLHVANVALTHGGHTAMLTRWIKNDKSGRIHSLALISQKSPIPNELLKILEETGGKVYFLNQDVDSFIQKACWLRKISHEVASYVVLHISSQDVIAGTAFGVNGGPPVLLVNHAAHIFWTGASIADLVINCRGSKLEEYWTKYYRGISRMATVPIPLPEYSHFQRWSNTITKKFKKEQLGILGESVVILTMGDSYKYLPMGKLNFIEVAEAIIEAVPNVYILVVGPEENEIWIKASKKLEFRLRILGQQSRSYISNLHQVVDIYIEGFPFGSTTALLEAGMCGIPVVLSPDECPPPYGSDGIAIDEILKRPSCIDEYINTVVFLASNPKERKILGAKLSNTIKKHHTGSGWRKHLGNALEKLPNKHAVYAIDPHIVPEPFHEYWNKMRNNIDEYPERILDYSIIHAFSIGLRPKITISIMKTCINMRKIRVGRTIPYPLLFVLCNLILPFIQIEQAKIIVQKTLNYFRDGSKTAKFLTLIIPKYFW